MDWIGLKCTKWIEVDQIGENGWNGLNWIKLDENGPSGSNWIELDRSEPNHWPHHHFFLLIYSYNFLIILNI